MNLRQCASFGGGRPSIGLHLKENSTVSDFDRSSLALPGFPGESRGPDRNLNLCQCRDVDSGFRRRSEKGGVGWTLKRDPSYDAAVCGDEVLDLDDDLVGVGEGQFVGPFDIVSEKRGDDVVVLLDVAGGQGIVI